MLLYGTAKNIINIKSGCHIYNFNSLVNGYENLGLIPPNSLGATTEYEFDVNYMNYIFSNDGIFMKFMNIIINLYYGYDVFIIVSDSDDWGRNLAESLLKIIQQRYGINGTEIDSFEDMDQAEESLFDTNYGLVNLDVDRERYIYLYESFRIASGGKIQYD